MKTLLAVILALGLGACGPKHLHEVDYDGFPQVHFTNNGTQFTPGILKCVKCGKKFDAQDESWVFGLPRGVFEHVGRKDR